MPHLPQFHYPLNCSGNNLTAAHEDTIDVKEKDTVGLKLFVFHVPMVRKKCLHLHLDVPYRFEWVIENMHVTKCLSQRRGTVTRNE